MSEKELEIFRYLDDKLYLGEAKFYNDGKLGIKALIDDFRKGRIGKICLEKVSDYEKITL